MATGMKRIIVADDEAIQRNGLCTIVNKICMEAVVTTCSNGKEVYDQLIVEPVDLDKKKVKLEQKTGYPYDGNITITTDTEGNYTVALRIPEWASEYNITINGEKIEVVLEKGYAYVTREWKEKDTIQVLFPMDIKMIEANPKAADLWGRVAVTRGPLVYCGEGIDNNYSLRDVRISRKSECTIVEEEIAGQGMPVLYKKAFIRKETEKLYIEQPLEVIETELKLIPYFAWTNRGVSEMTTWFLYGMDI